MYLDYCNEYLNVLHFFYTKGLICRQVLCDCILAPKRYSYTQRYLLEVQIENFHCTSANHGLKQRTEVLVLPKRSRTKESFSPFEPGQR